MLSIEPAFFLPKPRHKRREREQGNEYIDIFKCLHEDIFQCRDLTLEVCTASFIR